MRAASLFAGIGALDLALQWCGVEVDVQVEIDSESRAVLERHFPEAERIADVRGVSLGPLDLVVGGFPCTGTSRAGKRTGLEHEESGLWREYARIVRESRPRLVLIENPSSLLHPGRGFETVSDDLIGLGYELRWECVPASAVGAPHQRDRVWIAAMADPGALDLLQIPDAVPAPWPGGAPTPVGARSTPDVRRRLRQLGLSAVPQAAVEAWRVLAADRPFAWWPGDAPARAGVWLCGESGPRSTAPAYPATRGTIPTPTAGDAKGARRFGYHGSTDRTLTDWVWERCGPQYLADPEFIEWLMGLPRGWTEKTHDRG